MKFTKGYWMNRPGVDATDTVQIREARFDGASLYLYAVNYGHDSRAMGGPILELTVSSPAPDIIRIEAVHFAGSRKKEPKFELNTVPVTPVFTEDGNTLTFESNSTSLVITKNPATFTYYYRGRRLTSVGERYGHSMISYLSTPEGPFMRGQLDLAIGEHVYGLGEKQVASNDQSFSKLGLKAGDKITIMTLRSEHNGLIEAGGQTPAYLVSKTAGEYKLGRKVASTTAKWMELPATSATDGQDLLIHSFPDGSRNYAAYWDYKNLVASWVAYPLCAGNIGSNGGRTDSFSLDPLLPRDKQPYLPSAFKTGNVTGSYDRGHQIPSADRLDWRVNLETFFGTNMTAQDNGLNGNAWGSLENKVRTWAKNSATDTLYVVTGCTGADVAAKYVLDYDEKHIAIPAGYYKALLRLSKDGKYAAVGFYFDNVANNTTGFKNISMSIDDLEKKVGVDFFVNLPADVQKTVEAQDPKSENWWWNN